MREKVQGVGFEQHFWVFAQGGEFNKSTPISSVNDSSGIDPAASALHFTSLCSPLRRPPLPYPLSSSPSFPHLADCELSTEMVRARGTEPRSQRALTLSPSHTPSIAFRHLPLHSEHRFPTPSSTLRASLSDTLLHTQSIPFRHLPPHSENRFPTPCSTLRASLSSTFLYTPSIAFRHLSPHSHHRFPASSSTIRASLSGIFPHTPKTAFRHLPPHSQHRFPAPSSGIDYATKGAVFISLQLSTDIVRLWKQRSVQACT